MFIRTKFCAPEMYRGRTISIVFLGPDFLAYVDDIELSAFYISPKAAVAGAQTYINDDAKAKEKK